MSIPQTHGSIDDKSKVGQSWLAVPEKRFIHWAVPQLPSWMRSTHLTLASLPISLGIIVFSYLGHFNLHWLWAVNVLIFSQWLTDSLDGALGRYRKEGLIKWGYYMDHLLDYFFLCAVLIGYSLQTNHQYPTLQLLVLALCGGFMVNSYLRFGATQELKIVFNGIGPTELRILFILLNTSIIIFGKTYVAPLLPYVLGACFLGLCVVVYHTQRELRNYDLMIKEQK